MTTISLQAVAREQLAAAIDATSGRAARTVHGGHDHALRQTVIGMRAGTVLDEHENPGEATVHVLSGRVRLSAASGQWEAAEGELVVIPQERHSLEALEDAVVLLTVAKLP